MRCDDCTGTGPRWIDRALIWLLVTPTSLNADPVIRWSGILGSALWCYLTVSSFMDWRRNRRDRQARIARQIRTAAPLSNLPPSPTGDAE